MAVAPAPAARRRRIGDLLLIGGRPLSEQLDQYTPKGQRILSYELPDNLSPQQQQAMLDFSAKHIGKFTIEARQERRRTELQAAVNRDAGPQSPAVRPPAEAKPGSPPEIVRGFLSGLRGQNVEATGRFLKAVPDIVGGRPSVLSIVTGMITRGVGGQIERAGRGQAQQPKVPSFKDVNSVRTAFDYAQFQLGQGVASSVPSIVGGSVGAGVGATVGGPPGAAAGAKAGAAAPSYVMNFGDVAQEVDEALPGASVQDRARLAAIIAVPVAALDAINPAAWGGAVAKKMMTRKILSAAVKNPFFKRVFKEALKGGLTEAATEATQEAIQKISVDMAAGRPVRPDELAVRLADAAIAGALTGATMGGAVAAIPESGRPPDAGEIELPDLSEAGPAPAPGPGPGAAPEATPITAEELWALPKPNTAAAAASPEWDAARPAVLTMRRDVEAKFGKEPNEIFGGLAPAEAFARAFNRNVLAAAQEAGTTPEALPRDALKAAAARAYKQVAGQHHVRQTMTLPPIAPGDPDGTRKLAWRQEATRRANELMGGRTVELTLPDPDAHGETVTGRVQIVRVEMDPSLREGAVRVLATDLESGKLLPLKFNNVQEFAAAMKVVAEPPSGRVAGRLTTSRVVPAPAPEKPSPVGEALAAAATAEVVTQPETLWRRGREAVDRAVGAARSLLDPSASEESREEFRAAILDLRETFGVDVTPEAVRKMLKEAKRGAKGRDIARSTEHFLGLLTRRLMNGLEGRVRALGRQEKQAAEEARRRREAAAREAAAPASPEPPAPTAPPAPPTGRAPAAVPPSGPAPTKPPAGAQPATTPPPAGTTAPAAPAAGLPTTYPSQSRGKEIPIRDMQDDHLRNAEAKQAAGPVKEALRREIARRGLAPKEKASGAAPKSPGKPGGDRGRDDDGGAVGGSPARPRVPVKGGGSDRVAVARPDVTAEVDDAGVPGRLREHLTEYQRQGVAKALLAMDDPERGAFLLADGTGVGKTRQILAVAEKYRAEGHPVVIVVPNEVVGKPWDEKSLKANGGIARISGSYANDGAAMGVELTLWRPKDGPMPTSGIVVTTYTYLTDPAVKEDRNAVYVFDESHALKNTQTGTRLAVKGRTLANAAHAALFASATPADKPTHIEYLARIGMLEGLSLRDAVWKLGFRLVEKGERKMWVPRQGVKLEQILKNMDSLFERMTKKGSMVKREISLEGVDIHFRRLAMPPEVHRQQAKIASHFDESNPRQRAIMLMHQRRQQEPVKAEVALDLAKQELAAGRSVILFVSRVNYSEVQVTIGKDARGERVRETIAESEGTAKLLRKMLADAGIPFAELHGAADTHAADAMEAFQSGSAKVLVATVESGGTGINLDDTVGNRPRTLIMVTAPFNGVSNVQAAGRVWRMTTKSLPRIIYLFGDTAVDDWNAAIIAKKMATLGATVSGQVKKLLIDPDLLDAAEPEDIGSLMGEEVGGEMTEPEVAPEPAPSPAPAPEVAPEPPAPPAPPPGAAPAAQERPAPKAEDKGVAAPPAAPEPQGEGWTRTGTFEPGVVPHEAGAPKGIDPSSLVPSVVVGRKGDKVYLHQAAGSVSRVVERDAALFEKFQSFIAPGTIHEGPLKGWDLARRQWVEVERARVESVPYYDNGGMHVDASIPGDPNTKLRVPLSMLAREKKPTATAPAAPAEDPRAFEKVASVGKDDIVRAGNGYAIRSTGGMLLEETYPTIDAAVAASKRMQGLDEFGRPVSPESEGARAAREEEPAPEEEEEETEQDARRRTRLRERYLRDAGMFVIGQRQRAADASAEIARGVRKAEKGKNAGSERKLTKAERARLEEDAAIFEKSAAERLLRVEEEYGKEAVAEALALGERAIAEQDAIDALPNSPRPDDENWQAPTPENVDKFKWNAYDELEVEGQKVELPAAVARAKFGKFPWEMSADEYAEWYEYVQSGRVWPEWDAIPGHVSAMWQVQAGLPEYPVGKPGVAIDPEVGRANDVFVALFKGLPVPEAVRAEFPWAARVLPPDKQMSEKEAMAAIERQVALRDDVSGMRGEMVPGMKFPAGHGRIVAVMDADGRVWFDGGADMHGDLVDDETGVVPEDMRESIIDGGWIVDGKYLPGVSDGGYSYLEFEDEDVRRTVEENVRRVNGAAPAAPAPPPGGQGSLPGMPPPVVGAAPGPAPTEEGNRAVEAMGGEVKTFLEQFEALLAERMSPAEAAIEATRLTGEKPPEGFDPEAAAREAARKALERAGQGDLFGGAPLLGREGLIGSAGAPEGADAPVELRPDLASSDVEGGGVGDLTVAPAEIRTHPRFQNRDTAGEQSGEPASLEKLVNQANVQTLLEAEGGYSPDQMKMNPPVVWRDAHGELGAAGQLWLLSGHHRLYLASHTFAKDENGRWAVTGTRNDAIPVKVIGGSLAYAERVAQLSNRSGIGNTHSELARLAYTALARGDKAADVAKQLRVRGAAEVERLADFYRVDADLRAQWFPPGAESATLDPRYASTIGSYVARWPKVFTKLVQEQFLKDALKRGLSLADLDSAIRAWKADVIDKLPQEQVEALLGEGRAGIMPSDWARAAGGLTLQIDDTIAQAHATMVGLVKQYVPAAKLPKKLTREAVQKVLAEEKDNLPKSVRAVLRDIADKMKKLERVRAEVEKRTAPVLQEAIEGKNVGDRLADIARYVWEELGAVASRSPLGGGFGALQPVVDWFLSRAGEGAGRALERFARGLGRKARTVNIKTPSGRIVAKHVERPAALDPPSEWAMYRNARTTPGSWMGDFMTLPPRLRQVALESRATLDSDAQMNLEELWQAVGRDFVLQVLQFHAESALAHAAMETLDPPGPNATAADRAEYDRLNTPAVQAFRRKWEPSLRAARTWFDALYANVAAVCNQNGVKPPKYRKNYISHIISGDIEWGLDDLAAFFHDRELGIEEKREVQRRFANQREGDLNYVRDFWVATQAYARWAAAYTARVPLLAEGKKVLSSEWSKADPQAAQSARAAILRWAFPKESAFTGFVNDHARALLFSRLGGGVSTIRRADAAKYLGVSEDELLDEQIDGDQLNRFVWVGKGQEAHFTQPKKWKKLGVTKYGATVYGGTAGHGYGAGGATLHPLLQRALDNTYLLRLRLWRAMGGKTTTREDEIAEMLRQRQQVQKLSREPGTVAVSWIGRRIAAAGVGLSVATQVVNMSGLLTHVLPEYGLRSFLAGLARYGRVGQRSAARGLAEYLFHHGMLSDASRQRMLEALPYTGEDLIIEAGQFKQGWATALDQYLDKLESGQHDIDVKVSRWLVHWMIPVEAVIRGISVMAAIDYHGRKGANLDVLARTVQADMEARNRFIRELRGEFRNEGSLLNRIAETEYFSNFLYDQMGEFSAMGDAWYKTFVGMFSTFPWSTFMHREVGGIVGSAHVARAALHRAFGGAWKRKPLRGSKLGYSYDVPHLGSMEPYGAPKGGLAKWLSEGGASYLDRQAAASFARWMVVTGMLSVASLWTGMNFMTAAAPFFGLLVLGAMRALYDDDELERAFRNYEKGLVFRAQRSGLVVGGPLLTALSRKAQGETWGDVAKGIGSWALEDVAIRALAGMFYRPLRGTLEVWPEVFDTDEMRWAYRVLGVKSALYDLSLRQKAQHALGWPALPPEVLDEHRRRVNAPAKLGRFGPPSVGGPGMPAGVARP